VISELERAKVDFMHLDLMDGSFAPKLGFPVEMLQSITKEVRLPADIHLLTVNPLNFVSNFRLRPFDQISVHIESVSCEKIEQTLSAMRKTGAKAGLALKLETSIESLSKWLPELDFVLLMGIELGQEGMSLSGDVLRKIRELKKMSRELGVSVLIEVDGGVNNRTVRKLQVAGADILVCGSIIFNAKGVVRSVNELRHMLGAVRKQDEDRVTGNADYLSLSAQFEPRFYTDHVPIVWKRAQGVKVWDCDNKEFLDFTSGILVANIGHSHPKYLKQISEQAEKLLACYDFANEPRILLAEKLIELTPANLDKVYLLTTGAEAVEAACKLARNCTGKSELISFYMSFHGRTNLTLSLGAKKTRKKGFGPFASGVIHAPYAYCYRCAFEKAFPDCDFLCVRNLSLAYDAASADDVAALIVEPYQGAGGIIVPPRGYLKKVQDWCHERGILLIVDEIQSGFGRTGRLFAIEHEGVSPNMLCLGKGLTSGIPGSAVIGESAIMDAARPGSMSTTYAGNPLAARAALAVLDIIRKEKLVQNSARLGKILLQEIGELKEVFQFVGDVRGLGLVAGLEFVSNRTTKTPAPQLAKSIVQECHRRGLLVLGPDGFYNNVVVIAPPLSITEEELTMGIGIIRDSLARIARS
jgi:4-aminobutyrate aminotransferase/ribulose-phosphate 3-epimerase